MDSNVELSQNDQHPVPAADAWNELQLIPLSIQQEGDSYLVGSLDLNRFYQMPGIGVEIIRLLQGGLSLEEIKRRLSTTDAAEFDLDDFASTLVGIGFAHVGSSPMEINDAPAQGTKWLQAAGKIGRAIFSWPSACLYSVVIIYAVSCVVKMPATLPSLNVFYFPHHLTASLLLLLLLYFAVVLLHELGHMLAAARVGINTYLGIGTRLWTIVMEADLTGVLSLPRRKRYLPLFAGLLTDVLNVSILVSIISHLVRVHANPFLIQLLQALIMQILLVMSWQTNVFLRTDLYYVMCTALAYPDMDRDARLYLRALAHKMTRRRFGTELSPEQTPRRLKIVRIFSAIWILGRLGSLYLLLVIALPVLIRYAVEDYAALTSASWNSLPYDFILFTVLSVSMLGWGMWMWISQMKSRRLSL